MKDILKIGVTSVIIALCVKSLISEFGIPKRVLNIFGVNTLINGDTIHVRGVGNYHYNSLITTKRIISQVYNVPVIIDEPITLTEEFYTDGLINGSDVLNEFDTDENTVLITSNKLHSDKNDSEVAGKGKMFNNIVIVTEDKYDFFKSVLIHETSHCEGLSHCDDESCIMESSLSKNNPSKTFCEKCRKKLDY
jgi:hypothetical protein